MALAVDGFSVVDGDTLKVNGERVRLLGIDAPEKAQTCDRDGEAWRCGKAARAYMQDLTAGKRIVCESDGRDRYNRHLARCSADGEDLSRAMLRGGMAVGILTS